MLVKIKIQNLFICCYSFYCWLLSFTADFSFSLNVNVQCLRSYEGIKDMCFCVSWVFGMSLFTSILLWVCIVVCLWSLQELLLCPLWRIEEYVTLLQALSINTHPDHPDHTHLSTALSTLLQFKQFIKKVKIYIPIKTRTQQSNLSWFGLFCVTIAFLVFCYRWSVTQRQSNC